MSDEFCGFDDEDFDGCEHGIGFDEECEDCEDDPIGCIFPGRCLMPGVHLESECHTVEMMKQMIKEGEAMTHPSDQPVEHGIETCLFDNLGNGWRMYCLCGYTTSPNKLLQAVGVEMDEHFEENRP